MMQLTSEESSSDLKEDDDPCQAVEPVQERPPCSAGHALDHAAPSIPPDIQNVTHLAHAVTHLVQHDRQPGQHPEHAQLDVADPQARAHARGRRLGELEHAFEKGRREPGRQARKDDGRQAERLVRRVLGVGR